MKTLWAEYCFKVTFYR